MKDQQDSVQCETCDQWGHVECLGITEERFNILIDYSFAWICPSCDSQNVTQRTSSDTSELSLNDSHPSSASDQDVTTGYHSIDDVLCSTPKTKSPEPPKKNRLSILIANVQSIMSKKESLWLSLESEKPDIVLACETWVKPDIFDSEVIPSDFEYEIFRKDRKDGYGGVLIAIKRNLVYEVIPIDKTCELVAVKITCKHNSS